VYPGKGNRSWEKGYFDENLYKWLFEQRLDKAMPIKNEAEIRASIKDELPALPLNQKREIIALIEGPGAPQFADRKAAHEKLIEVGRKALPVLEEYRKDDDPERRVRVLATIKAIESTDSRGGQHR
jgi:hypothetical protein